MEKLPEEIKLLANAYSNQNVLCNRVWVTGAVIFLTTTTISFDKQDIGTIIGISIAKNTFFTTIFLISTFVHFAYCSIHLKLYEIADMYLELIHRNNLQDVKLAGSAIYDGGHTYKDFAHSVVTPNYNRTFPLKKSLDRIIKKPSWQRSLQFPYLYYKFLVDWIYASVPFISVSYALYLFYYIAQHTSLYFIYTIVYILFCIIPYAIMVRIIYLYAFYATRQK